MVSSPSGIHLHFHGPVNIHMYPAGPTAEMMIEEEPKALEAGEGVLSPLESTRALPPTHPNNMGEAQKGQWLVRDQEWFKAKYPVVEDPEPEPEDEPESKADEAHRWPGWFTRRRATAAAE
jgi:hypothetical protein